MNSRTPFKMILGVIAAVAIASSAVSASAAEKGAGGNWMTQGAEILPMGTHAFEARFGFPSTDFGVHIPVNQMFEVTPFFTMDYLAYAGNVWAGTFGDTLGTQLKFKLWGQGPMAVALAFDLGLAMDYLNTFDFGIQIGGPEVKFSYRWANPRIGLMAGFKMPVVVWILDVGNTNAACGYIPLLFTVGTEYNILSNLNIHAQMEIGPGIVATGGRAVVGAHFGFQFGISYLF